MRKILALLVIVAIAYVAVTGSLRVSDDTLTKTDAFVCGVAESTRTALNTGGEAARAAAGLIRDNTDGTVRELAQRVVDLPDSGPARQQLQEWVDSACNDALPAEDLAG